MTECIIGIDGGGTKTLLQAADRSGTLLCQTTDGPSNLCSGSEEDVRLHLKQLWEKAICLAPLAPQAVCLGTAGISAPNAAERLGGMLREITGCSNVRVLGDMEIPLEVYSPNEDSMLLISGTGSICYARSHTGAQTRSGGFGHLLGDEGSGYWIASEALKIVCRQLDAAVPKPGVLAKLLLSRIGASDCQGIIGFVYRTPFDKSRIAALAPAVLEAAQQGDWQAKEILAHAAQNLFELTKNTWKKAGLSASDCRIFLNGGILFHFRPITEALMRLWRDYDPSVQLIRLHGTAADGALCLARRAADFPEI